MNVTSPRVSPDGSASKSHWTAMLDRLVFLRKQQVERRETEMTLESIERSTSPSDSIASGNIDLAVEGRRTAQRALGMDQILVFPTSDKIAGLDITRGKIVQEFI